MQITQPTQGSVLRLHKKRSVAHKRHKVGVLDDWQDPFYYESDQVLTESLFGARSPNDTFTPSLMENNCVTYLATFQTFLQRHSDVIL